MKSIKIDVKKSFGKFDGKITTQIIKKFGKISIWSKYGKSRVYLNTDLKDGYGKSINPSGARVYFEMQGDDLMLCCKTIYEEGWSKWGRSPQWYEWGVLTDIECWFGVKR